MGVDKKKRASVKVKEGRAIQALLNSLDVKMAPKVLGGDRLQLYPRPILN